MNISKGRYWDKPWSLVDGCTPCSPGCENCWSMAMGKRFHRWPEVVEQRYDRLEMPMKTKKPTVFAIWNDLFHEDVSYWFVNDVWIQTQQIQRHTYLILTKRPERMKKWTDAAANAKAWPLNEIWPESVWLGCTVCNQ
jgi:protein gp37